MKAFGRHESEEEMLSALMTREQTAKTYLLQCGNKIVEPESEDEATIELLYELLNRKTSTETPLSTRSNEVIARHLFGNDTDGIADIPATEFFRPLRLWIFAMPIIFLLTAPTTVSAHPLLWV